MIMQANTQSYVKYYFLNITFKQTAFACISRALFNVSHHYSRIHKSRYIAAFRFKKHVFLA